MNDNKNTRNPKSERAKLIAAAFAKFIANGLSEKQEDSGLNKKQFAQQVLGIEPGTYTAIETGRTGMSPERAIIYAKKAGMELKIYLDGEEFIIPA